MVIPIDHFFSLILVVSGIIFRLAAFLHKRFPPKQINFFYGYRTRSSMKNIESWNFAQSLTSRKMKNMSFCLIGLGLIMSFVKLEMLLSLWIGTTIVISMVVLMIFKLKMN
tara:strand:- start:3063 stop:3395 length:333 start_codon:yes stop_codon:yes gene_type:complete